MNNQLKGLLITTLGVLFVVPDSLFIRLLDAEPLVTAYWRSMTVGVFVLIWVLVTQGIKGFGPVMRTGRAGLLYVVALGAMAPAFVMAIANTSVANVVFILAAISVFSLLFSRLFLGEPISKRMVMTMAAVGAGLAIIASGMIGFTDVQTLVTQLMSYFRVITNPVPVFVTADKMADGKIIDDDVKSRLNQMVDKTLELAKRN